MEEATDKEPKLGKEVLKEMLAMGAEQARFEQEVNLMKSGLADSLRSGVCMDVKQDINEPMLLVKKGRPWALKWRLFCNRIKTVFGWT